MKKYAIIFSCAFMAIAVMLLASCNLELFKLTQYSDDREIYLDLANDYIEAGEYGLAVDVLRKGIAATGDSELSALYNEILQIHQEESTDIWDSVADETWWDDTEAYVTEGDESLWYDTEAEETEADESLWYDTEAEETEAYIPEETEDSFPEMPTNFGFVTNLDFYEEYMNPGTTEEFLILVNRKNTLSADYAPQDMVEVAATRQDGRTPRLMRLNAAMALEAMFKELYAAGFYDVSVTSGYRSYSYQKSLYDTYVQIHGEEQAKTFSMPAGASEHQTGLSVDMHNLPSADKAFANEPAYEWLRTNCWKFGFILRFPEDKIDITEIDFEPGHFRYVGRYHAWRMYSSGMCLEEYVGYIA